LTFLVFGIISINAKSDQNSAKQNKIELFEVAETQVFCEQMVPRKCLSVKREKSENFEALYDEIENFKFISGYKYVLRVAIEKIEYPPKDTSGYKYYLKEIISRKKVEKIDQYAELYLSKWFLTSIKGKVVEDGKPYLIFDKNEKGFYGNSGCNSLKGQFKIDGNSFGVSKIIQTKRACQIMQTVEIPFILNLSEANQIKVEIDRLYLLRDGVVLLEFRSNWE
jgi:heat shock protein HslJ